MTQMELGLQTEIRAIPGNGVSTHCYHWQESLIVSVAMC